MNPFFKLIHKVEEDINEFNTQRFIDISKSLTGGESNVDDFLIYFVMFLYKYPIEDDTKLFKVYQRASTISERVGIVSKHMIRTANKIGVDSHLIDLYFECKESSKLWSKIYDRELEDNSYSDHSVQTEIYKNIYGRQFNKMTFTIIQSILDK